MSPEVFNRVEVRRLGRPLKDSNVVVFKPLICPLALLA